MKTCFKCGEEKPIDDFYKHPQMADGRLNKCKECTKKDTKENRLKNYDYYRDYDAKRSKTPKRKELSAKMRIKYRQEHPERLAIYDSVARARGKGEIIPPESCPCCGHEGNLIAHHPDYTKPLDIEWMCQRCHKILHANMNKQLVITPAGSLVGANLKLKG